MGIFSASQLGVEISGAAVRVVGVSGGKKPLLVGCKEVILTQHEPAAISNAIKEAMKTAAPHRLAKGPATILLSEKELFRKTIELPPIQDPSEQREAIRLEVAQYLPESKEEVEFDYQSLGTMPDGKSEQFMVVTVSASLIAQYVSTLKLAGLPVAAVDTIPAAIGRATVAVSEKKAVLTVTIEEHMTVLSIYRQGIVWVSSTLNMGIGVEADDPAYVKRFTSALVDEVDHIIKFYRNRAGGEHGSLSDARLIGAGAAFPEIKAMLEKDLSLKASVAKASIAVPAFCDARFLPALGASLYAKFEKI